MAVEVEMNDDIRKYDIKTIGPFTTRQAVCTCIALLYAIPVGIWVPFSIEYKILMIAIVAAPMVAAGYIKIDGAKFETFLMRLLYWKVLAPGRRRYKSYNTFRKALKDMRKSSEKRHLAKMSEKQRKDYIKRKSAQKVIHYSRKPQYKVYK